MALLTAYFLTQQVRESRTALERKAAMYGRLVSKEVASAIAFDDQETARELFDSVAQDSDIESLVLFTASGSTLYSRGAPGAWISAAQSGVLEQKVISVGDRIAVVAPVVSAEGPRGTLVVELSTRALLEANQRMMRTSLLAAAAALLIASLLAYLIARSLGKRLWQISGVATAVTEGDLDHAPVTVTGNDEISLLAHAFNAMLAHIQVLVQEMRRNAEEDHARLEALVGKRTSELDQRNSDMRLVLDNVDQGFFSVDLAGKLSQERSEIATRWLGAPLSDDTFFTWMDRAFPGRGDYFRVGWDALRDDWMPLEMRLDQLPFELCAREQSFRLAYKPIFEANELTRLLVVMTDTTALVARQRIEEEERELAQAVRKMLEDRNGFRDFVAEADELVTAIESDATWQCMRHLHTLKGNAAIFGFTSLARLCHDLESSVEEKPEGLSTTEIALLRTTWKRLSEKVSSLNDGRPNMLEVAYRDYDDLLRRIDSHAPPVSLRATLLAWKLEPTESRLSRLAEYASTLAERLGKNPLNVVVESNGVRLDPQAWSYVWQALVHVVRNAVDHGLETSEQRLLQHKPETGSLILRTRREGAVFSVEIEDGGRGIDWEHVARAAKQGGLASETHEDLHEALMADGVSTREQVTETSGRGVGMSAVKRACLESGGRIRIESQVGRGTCFRFEWSVDESGRPMRRFDGFAPANDTDLAMVGLKKRVVHAR